MAQAATLMSVDLGALAANWRLLARRVAPARCGAVVKADAYGLGANPVVRTLLHAGCREFFVAGVDEGIRLRAALAGAWPADASLHLLHGAEPQAEAECLAHGLVPVLGSVVQLARWQALARRVGRELPAALQVDTGLSRLGLSPAALAARAEAPDGLAGIAPTLLLSGLARAEVPDDPVNRRQLALFRGVCRRFPGVRASLAESAGLFLGPDFHLDLVRPGAALYGASPPRAVAHGLLPVVQLEPPSTPDAEALARMSTADAYEILTGLGAHCRRRYLGGEPL